MDNEEQSITAASAVEPAAGPVQRINMVFFSPGKLGEHLRQASPWFWTLAIVGVVSAIAWVLLPTELLQRILEARPQPQDGPDMETMIKFSRIFAVAVALVGTFIAAAVIAGCLYLVFNLILGQEHSYRQHMSATAHIYWITLLGFLLTIPLWLAKEDMQIKLGLGLILPDEPSSFVEHLLNSVGIFGLWGAVALGAVQSGLSAGRISGGKAIAAVLGLYLVWVLGSAVWATFFGA